MIRRAARSIRLFSSVLAAEGPRAAVDRVLDRLAERKRRRKFLPAGPEAYDRTSLVNLLATPPDPRFGGVQSQFAARIASEARTRPVATLYPDGAGLRMEVQAGGRSREFGAPFGNPGRTPPLEDARFEEGVALLARRIGASVLHVENPAGLPLRSLIRLGDSFPLVVSVHDFSPFCARSDLLELPAGAFCGYCSDDVRCHACLLADRSVEADFPRAHRRAGREILERARAVIFPSDYLRSRFDALFPGLPADRLHVVAPAGTPPAKAFTARGPIRHVAFVGSVTAQKGAREFGRLVSELGPKFPRVRWTAYGKGDRAELKRLRSLGRIRVRGYYRAGSLPRLLRGDRADLALALSITPESYGLVVDECLAAGVPVLAFDHGAAPSRLREGGGVLVDPSLGCAGLADALGELLAGATSPPPLSKPVRPANAAERHLALYRSLGLLGDGAGGSPRAVATADS